MDEILAKRGIFGSQKLLASVSEDERRDPFLTETPLLVAPEVWTVRPPVGISVALPTLKLHTEMNHPEANATTLAVMYAPTDSVDPVLGMQTKGRYYGAMNIEARSGDAVTTLFHIAFRGDPMFSAAGTAGEIRHKCTIAYRRPGENWVPTVVRFDAFPFNTVAATWVRVAWFRTPTDILVATLFVNGARVATLPLPQAITLADDDAIVLSLPLHGDSRETSTLVCTAAYLGRYRFKQGDVDAISQACATKVSPHVPGKFYVSGIPEEVTRADLARAFERFGGIKDSIEINRERAFAYISINDTGNEAARIVLEEFKHTPIDIYGKRVFLQVARANA